MAACWSLVLLNTPEVILDERMPAVAWLAPGGMLFRASGWAVMPADERALLGGPDGDGLRAQVLT